MEHNDLEKFTHEELSYFTNEELELLPADLMRRLLDRNGPLPPSAVEKLNALIEQTNNQIDDSDKKITKRISKSTKTIDLLKLLVFIIYNAPKIAEGFIFILESVTQRN